MRCTVLAVLVVAGSFAFSPYSAAAELRPDLVVERWTTPTIAAPNTTITVGVRIANTGQAVSRRFVSELRLDSSTPNDTVPPPVRWTTEPTRPGQAAQANVKLPIPKTVAPGEYVLRVLADVANAVVEENEHNNVAERVLIIALPIVPPSPTP
jgi:subtilase family serine protease